MSQANLDQVKRLADQLSFAEKLSLVEHLAQQLRQTEILAVTAHKKKPQDLRGVWRGRFPENLDLDQVLDEIRHEWEKEWPQVFKK
jgi:hypothetical protein